MIYIPLILRSASILDYDQHALYINYNQLRMLIQILYVCLALPLITPLCTNVTFTNQNSYDLSHLSSIRTGDTYSFNFCTPILCTNVNNSTTTIRSGFIVNNSNTQDCQALTPSTEPTLKNYTQFQGGLSILYPALNSTYTSVYVYCSTSNTYLNTNMSDGNIIVSIKSPAGCSFDIPNQFWQFLIQKKLIFALLLWAVGLFEIFFGYFFMRITIFLFGIITAAGFSVIYFAMSYPVYQQDTDIMNFMVILSFILGVFYAFFLLTLPKFGYFNIGVWWGAIITLMLQNSFLYLSNSLIPFYITLGVACLALGCLALMSLKFFIIVSTSMISGFLLVRPLGFYLDYYPNQFEFYKGTSNMPWQYYLYLTSMLVLMGISIAFQTWLFRTKGKKDKLYYLEQEGDFMEKFKKILEFKEVKDAIQKGKVEFQFLKKLIVDKDDTQIQSLQTDNEHFQEVDQKPKKKEKSISRSQPPIKKHSKKQSQSQQLQQDVEIEMVEIKKKTPKKKIVKS